MCSVVDINLVRELIPKRSDDIILIMRATSCQVDNGYTKPSMLAAEGSFTCTMLCTLVLLHFHAHAGIR